MTRLPLAETRRSLLVAACLLVAAVGGALAGAPASAPAAGDAGDCTDAHAETDASAEASASDRALVVADAETGERLLAVPVAEGTTVALDYTHSVEKTPVLDVYAVNGTELEMVRMEFQSYGAGLPARADVNVTENGTFVFDPPGSYEHLYVTPGTVADHQLRVGSLTYDLGELSDGRTVRLSVEYWSAATNASAIADASAVADAFAEASATRRA